MKTLIFMSIICSIILADGIDWHVIDNGGGMINPASTSDTLWASISQTAIGPSCQITACVCAGYLYVFEGTCFEILESGKDTKKPYTFGIDNISPNPFNPTCQIVFEIEDDAQTEVAIFDITGRQIERPVSEHLQPGKYRLTWNGGNNPSGTYFARLTSGNQSVTNRIVYLK